MANNKFVYQQQTNVSIPRAALVRFADADWMKAKDYKVLMALFTTLDGWNGSETRTADPENYKAVKKGSIADLTGLKKKEVEESIEKFLEHGVIRKGSNDTVSKGYRFTF